MNTIGYFEIHSSDPAREIKFYSAVFGWSFERDLHVPIEYYRIGSAGMNGAMLKRPAKIPGMEFGTNAFCCSFEVAEFDTTEKVILENGGKVAMPKFAIPGKCWQGYFLDTEGNTFGIFEVDLSAK